jgi:hypothetical protein
MKILSFSGKWMARRSDSDWGHDSIVRAFAYKCEALSSIPSTAKKRSDSEGQALDVFSHMPNLDFFKGRESIRGIIWEEEGDRARKDKGN